MAMLAIAPGDAVLTKYGAGVVVRCFSDDDENDCDGRDSSSSPSSPSASTRQQTPRDDDQNDEVNDDSATTAVDATGTSSSSSTSATAKSSSPSSTWATVRLWRRPGRSIASCATATLRLDDARGGGGGMILQKLVAAPGMIVRATTTTTTSSTTTAAAENTIPASRDDKEEEKDRASKDGKRYLIERYVPSRDVYLASCVDEDEGDVNDDRRRSGGLARSLSVVSSGNANDGSTTTSNSNNHGADATTTTTATNNKKERYHELHPSQIIPSSSSAKFYPILEELIARGEAAWTLAVEKTNERAPDLKENAASIADKLTSAVTVTTSNNGDGDVSLNMNGVAKVLADTSKSSMETLNQKLSNATLLDADTDADGHSQQHARDMTAKQALDMATTKATATAQAATDGLSLSLPQSEEIKHIYNMLRDDDLTLLFERGKERLKELVDVEIPERTKKALGAMGIELEDDDDDVGGVVRDGVEKGKRSIRGGMGKLRKEALKSLDQILKMEVAEDGNIVLQTTGSDNGASVSIDTKNILGATSPTNAAELKQNALRQFATTFDSLSRVASSDPQLLQIFGNISDKTKVWQEMTGRILQTKTASLFLEGGMRLKARAADILGGAPEQLKGALGGVGGVGGASNGDLTKAFTEGDVAIAKLKSMEMGDAVRRRLFAAIELRSESSGGLDAIIAGSLSAIQLKGDACNSKAASLLGSKGLEELSLSSTLNRAVASSSGDGISEESVQSVISNLQSSATSAMGDTKETLIALLSRRSAYRDALLLRLERVFLDLESTLGSDLTAEQIARLAAGEGGSMSLFEPVARKAAAEIETQLDLAEEKMRESKHWNDKAENVLVAVRKLTSGEMGMMDLLDMAAGYLDDEEVVNKSGGLIVKAESLLDDFEAASARLGDAASSGSLLSKSAAGAMGGEGGGIMEAVAKAGITKSSLMENVSNLDVNKLLDDTQSAVTDERVRRELISSAGDTALDFLLKILPSMPVPPFDGVRDGLVYHLSNLSMAGFKVRKEDIYIEIAGIRAAAEAQNVPQSTSSVKASELLIIDVKNISATLDNAVWSFEQTYMPYLRGSGKANTRLWDGAIRLKFELRRRLVEATNTWEPVLCLNDRACSIGGVELMIQGEGRLAWAANKLASLLKNPLRDYVVSVIVSALTNNSGWLIDMLNQNLSNYWDFVLRTAKLELDQLPKLAQHHVTKAEIEEDEDQVELVWRERVPLGLNILTNDESGYLKVIDLPRGTQARKVAQSNQLDPEIFRGATIVSVNGRRYGPESRAELFAALRDPARPKAVLFKLATVEDAEKMEKIADYGKKGAQSAKQAGKPTKKEKEGNLITVVDIEEKEDIGLKFSSAHDNFGLVVSAFLPDPRGAGRLSPAEKTGKIALGDLLSHVNGTLVLGAKGTGKRKALELLEAVSASRQGPLSLSFVKPYHHTITVEKDAYSENESFGGPSELMFTEVKSSAEKGNSGENSKIVLKDFAPAEGAAETGGVFVGDNLAFINGIPVGAGCRLLDGNNPSPKLNEVIGMLKQYAPLALTFARPPAKQNVKTYLTSSPLSLDIESAYTFSIAASDYTHLGCKLSVGMNGSDIVVRAIGGVDGPFQRQMKAASNGKPDTNSFIGFKLESVDGEPVPSYVNSQLIINAMKRRWAANGRVELSFCNERHRDALRKVLDLG